MGSVKKPCTGCRGWALPGKSKCDNCLSDYDKAKKARRNNGSQAAAKIRKYLKAYPGELFRCNGECSKAYQPSAIHVDHIIPLADGGLDIDQNIQLLCESCHKSKTRRENSERAKRARDF